MKDKLFNEQISSYERDDQFSTSLLHKPNQHQGPKSPHITCKSIQSPSYHNFSQHQRHIKNISIPEIPTFYIMFLALWLLLIPTFQVPSTIVQAHHEPKCPDGTSPQSTDPLAGTSKHCTCESTHETGMEITCSNMKEDKVTSGLDIFKNNSEFRVDSLILQLNYLPTVHNDTFLGLTAVKDIQFRLNRIKNFSANAFHGLEDSLEKLTILEFFWVSFKYKTLDKIPVEALAPLKNLKDLFISSANIRTIPSRAFYTLNSLQNLRIMSFTLNKLQNDSLAGLQNLKDFSIVTNFLKEIPPLLFAETPNLEKLFLSLKSFKEITKDHFSNLRYLRELTFNNSGIETIADGSFSKISNSLKMLSLKGAQLSNIPSAISDLPKLTHLDLSSNTIFDINANALSGLMSLEHLVLAYNIIKSIKSNVLADSKWLKFIDLKANLLTQVPDNFFPTFRNLETLDLSKNFIADLPELTFYQNDKLKTLDLSNNNLKSISTTSFKSLGKSLSFLDLSHNYLPNLPDKTFSDFENLVYLNISHNNMTTFNIDDLEGSEDTLRFIGLSNNPWHCDCNMRRFRDWYKYWSSQLSHSDKYLQELEMQGAKCHTPISLAGVPLLYPPRNAFTYCENSSDFDENGNKIKTQYHIKGTNEAWDSEEDEGDNNNNVITDNRIDKEGPNNRRRGSGPQSAAVFYMNDGALKNIRNRTNLALGFAGLTFVIVLATFLGKFLFGAKNANTSASKLSSFANSHFGHADSIGPNGTGGNNKANNNGKLGHFLSNIPVNLKNGHVPEDKQTIANHGFPMGTVA